jgi:BASS family bile acid:Na+ symporter
MTTRTDLCAERENGDRPVALAQILVDVAVPVSVACLMLLIGMTAGQEGRPTRAQMTSLAVGSAAQFLVLPLVAVAIILVLRPEPLAATAIALLAFAPAGTLSNYFTLINRGRVALSICLTAVGTLVYAAGFPVLAMALRGLVDAELAGLSVVTLARDLAVTMLLPVLAGAWIGRRFPGVVARHRGGLEAAASLLVLPLLALSLWAGRGELAASALPIAMVATAFTLGALAVGWLAGRLLRPADRATVAIECATRNVPVVVVLSDGVLAPSAALAAATGIFLCQSVILLAFSLATREAAPEGRALPAAGTGLGRDG